MAIGAKRKRAPAKGLPPGERLKRDKLAGAELYPQWAWVSRISDSSQITAEHRLAACGFIDKVGKPICHNKYAEPGEPEPKKRKVDVAQETKSKSVADEDVEDIIIISSDDGEQPLCNKKRCKDNPQCVNYLGQVSLENQDVALQAFLEASSLGPSPLSNAREPGLPIGLRNLGATCYANAFIQERRLGHSTSDLSAYTPSRLPLPRFGSKTMRFAKAFIDANPLKRKARTLRRALVTVLESPIFQLQVTFAALQESTQNVFNPIKLAESLQLRASEQQDAQEFSKLFMSHLATEFGKQAVPSLKTLLADQFEGKQTYGTMCQKCHHRSERDTDFLELEINVETNGILEERIEALLQSEELTDDNRYYCSRCDGLQDAIRYTKLRILPPVLHFSVLRFVFDLATLSRKKSKQAIMFPLVLDMAPFVDPEESDEIQVPAKRRRVQSANAVGSSSLVYELRGVLLHKGPSAYHGHYEAQVFDVTTKQFYQFNDETVTPIASLLSNRATNGDAGNEKRRKTYPRKKGRIDDSDVEAESDIRKVDHASSYISSKDAYMLIYARRESGALDASQEPLPEPPRLARERVSKLNKAHDISCASYLEREAKLTTAFKLMRQMKMDIYRRWHICGFREESAVVSRTALEDWLSKDIQRPKKKSVSARISDANLQGPSRQSSRSPEVVDQGHVDRSESPVDPRDLLEPSALTHGYRLDNSSIVCRHGGLDPRKAGDAKRITRDSLVAIRNETGCFFDPEVTTEDICQPCVEEMFLERRYALDHPSQVEQFSAYCECDNGTEGAWVSRVWLKDWKQERPKMHVLGQKDPAPDGSEYAGHVKCAHGQVSLSTSLREWINGEACTFLQSLFPSWRPVISRFDDPHRCSACDEELSLSKETRQELKQRADKEKEKLRSIISSNVLAMDPTISPGVSQAIVSADFLRQWRAWINRPNDKPRPGTIDNTWLICQHDRLIIDPSMPQDMGTSISLISIAEWEILQELYGGGPSITLTGHTSGGQGSEHAIAVAHDFEVCQECRHHRLRNFKTATISIRILGDEPVPSPVGPQSSTIESPSPDASQNSCINGTPENPSNRGQKNGQPLRVSSRLRNSRRKAGRKTITIKKLTTIRDIKIELYDELNIPTICQRLFFRGKELTDNLETMASLGILANDTLDLREEKEDDDALKSDREQGSDPKQREEGRAFGGTILSGISRRATSSSERDRHSSPEVVSTPNHCPVCTFINPDDLDICNMCGSKTA